MKIMNKKLLSILIVLMSMSLTSCSKKDDVVIDSRDQFVSTYDINETYIVNGTTYTGHYSMTISKSAQDPTVILLSNFAGFTTPIIVTAVVSGTKFSIAQQTVQGSGFSGSGTISGSNLSFSYQQSLTGTGLWNVSATGTKM